MRVAAFTKYGRESASTRQRLLQYLPSLREAGFEVDYHPLLSNDYVRGLATGQRSSRVEIAQSYLRRLKQLLVGPDCDLIWLYAELFPYLPAAFEKLAFSRGKPVIYDFDDAFFVPYEQSPRPWMRYLLSRKLEPLLEGAAACTCGNEYLREYAARFCEQSIVLPTVVDTSIYKPAATATRSGPLVIGWIGSPSTWCNMQPILPLLEQLCREFPVRLRAVGAGIEAERDRFPSLELVEWSEESEVAEVRAMDIGLMPLLDRPFQRGKSGYKLVQYMACGLPVVASPVGVNSQIVSHGENGFLASSEGEWRDALIRLIGDPAPRAGMGRVGRALVESSYSLASQAPRLIEVFRRACALE